MTISRRTKTGWDSNVKNKDKSNCDICGDRLWVTPGDTFYCNGNWDECVKGGKSMKTHKLSKEENTLLLDVLEEVMAIEEGKAIRDLYKRLGGTK